MKSFVQFVTKDHVSKEMMNLDGFKAIPTSDTSINTLKSNVDIHLQFN